jgi:hypothetical protein
MLPAAARLSRLLLRAHASRVGTSAAPLPHAPVRVRALPTVPPVASRATFRTRAAFAAAMDSADAGAAAAAAPAAKKPRARKAPAADAPADAAAGGAEAAAKPKGRGRAKAAAATDAGEGDEAAEGGAGGSPSKAPVAKKAKAEPAEKTVLPRTPTPRAPPPAGCVLCVYVPASRGVAAANASAAPLDAHTSASTQNPDNSRARFPPPLLRCRAAAPPSRRCAGTWRACAPC